MILNLKKNELIDEFENTEILYNNVIYVTDKDDKWTLTIMAGQ
jgi:hypothetical protein